MSKQGRPKSKKTLEKERVAKLFNEIKKSPGYTYKGPEIDFVQADKVEKQILKQYRVSAAITKTIAFAMASLGFETSAKEDKQTIKTYKDALNTIHEGQKKGAISLKEKADTRAQNLWGKNRDLIDQIRQGKSLDEMAKKILNEWSSRGDNLKKPHLNTIKNLHKKYIN